MKILHLLIYSICNLLIALFIVIGCNSSNKPEVDTKQSEMRHSKLNLIEKKEYKECFMFNNQYNMFWPQRDVQIEMNHALRIEWLNFEDFKEFFKKSEQCFNNNICC